METTTAKKQQRGKKGGTNNNNNKRNNGGGDRRNYQNRRNNNNNSSSGRRTASSSSSTPSSSFDPHLTLEECLTRYNNNTTTPDFGLIRGTLRVIPGTTKTMTGFCTCDRGSLANDVLIEGIQNVNRAMHGDTVFVELLNEDEEDNQVGTNQNTDSNQEEAADSNDDEDDGGDRIILPDDDANDVPDSFWQDDPVQMELWAPIVPIQRRNNLGESNSNIEKKQRRGKVVHVVMPQKMASEINPSVMTQTTHRTIVGTLKRLESGTVLFICSNRSLPQFFCSASVMKAMREQREASENSNDNKNDIYDSILFQAKYRYGSWSETSKWPPCTDLQSIGEGCNVHDETRALLLANDVDHGEFPPSVLAECGNVVKSGEMEGGGWKPTPEMYEGRRDYRHKRIFTIDPTTARDLDDALHVELVEGQQVEIGVHIADVSHFVTPNSEIDREAQRRCTTVYLVDRVIPMLPRPLCEIACSLNENVERLAFSCVWRMNLDGTMDSKREPWFGRTVIRSCARLDYATAQNIIDGKVGAGEAETDETLWPPSRRPTGGHTMEEVAADVKLMNRVAQARRQLRFANGALALSAIKLTFQLGDDGETPTMAEPYPIRDSNRLIEEYMLLANYLVAQRLITHADDKALLRHHEPPLEDGLGDVKRVAKEAINFDIDITSSQSLQATLNRLGIECRDSDPIVLQCITQMLKTPFKPANYIVAGEFAPEQWAHFALNIPYYTHFTSPIRRYADVMVHRVLQATIDDTVDDLPYETTEMSRICNACNTKKDASRLAQERSDEVFLALYLRNNPLNKQLGIVLSVGRVSFKVFVPKLGMTILLYLEEHKDWISWEAYEHQYNNRIRLNNNTTNKEWNEMTIKVFAKIQVSCICRDRPPISIRLRMEGPWEE